MLLELAWMDMHGKCNVLRKARRVQEQRSFSGGLELWSYGATVQSSVTGSTRYGSFV